MVPLQQLSHHLHMQFQVLCVAYNPFHGELYSGAQESVIKAWDAVTGQLLRRLTGHKGWVTDLLYVPAARLLFSCSLDHTIKAWTDLGQEVQVRGHACQLQSKYVQAEHFSCVPSQPVSGLAFLWHLACTTACLQSPDLLSILRRSCRPSSQTTQCTAWAGVPQRGGSLRVAMASCVCMRSATPPNCTGNFLTAAQLPRACAAQSAFSCSTQPRKSMRTRPPQLQGVHSVQTCVVICKPGSDLGLAALQSGRHCSLWRRLH